MWKTIVYIFIVCSVISCQITDDPDSVIWSDEFNYTGLPDSTKWQFDTEGNIWGWGNNELQYCTSRRDSNIWVDEGTLKIIAHKEFYHGKQYTSARIATKNIAHWKYVTVKVRAKMPLTRGICSAIWMLPEDWYYGPWPESGEIKIAEHLGHNPQEILSNVQTKKFNHLRKTQKGTVVSIENPGEFNIYELKWFKNKIEFYVNGEIIYTYYKDSEEHNEWPFDKEFYLIINQSIGGDWSDAKGVDDSAFPTTLEIDYVRVLKN